MLGSVSFRLFGLLFATIAFRVILILGVQRDSLLFAGLWRCTTWLLTSRQQRYVFGLSVELSYRWKPERVILKEQLLVEMASLNAVRIASCSSLHDILVRVASLATESSLVLKNVCIFGNLPFERGHPHL